MESYSTDYCYIHNRMEPDMPSDFLACGECHHVWRTAAEMAADIAARELSLADDGLMTTLPGPAEAVVCPLCTHDL